MGTEDGGLLVIPAMKRETLGLGCSPVAHSEVGRLQLSQATGDQQNDCNIQLSEARVASNGLLQPAEVDLECCRSSRWQRLVECKNCGRKIKHAKNLRRHEDVCRQNITIHPCELCSATFTRSDSLLRHLRDKHFARESLLCNKCGLRFRSRKELESHAPWCNK